MSLNAYAKAQLHGESPTETEYRLFARVTGALKDARDQEISGPALMKTLDWNRRMWSALAMDCASDGNGLPNETRAGVISLSIFVRKHSRKVFRGEASIDDLIEVNRRVMAGLEAQINRKKSQAGTPAAAPASAGQTPPRPGGYGGGYGGGSFQA
ncbi:hypothetical protein CCR85_06300 [Rhodothalassium salexigens]|uniref:flagellar biosynthesis regulator FlaF n=1 Tax=Rhodothalassium salexigens TaxID=1086 RepID=UPI001913A8E0|nr:flagellar biosynthesis regulator FlaF [Rhodothalassium salexigens]MBK5911102.1 hypothetical protein [Rhodothalassium salexigens]MBK5921750.1 hypothetical protein [Rhodothalassium salexigens]